jgi:hypothetical protein
VTMQVFVHQTDTMIAAPIQCDVDRIPKGTHGARVPTMAWTSIWGHLIALALRGVCPLRVSDKRMRCRSSAVVRSVCYRPGSRDLVCSCPLPNGGITVSLLPKKHPRRGLRLVSGGAPWGDVDAYLVVACGCRLGTERVRSRPRLAPIKRPIRHRHHAVLSSKWGRWPLHTLDLGLIAARDQGAHAAQDEPTQRRAGVGRSGPSSKPRITVARSGSRGWVESYGPGRRR